MSLKKIITALSVVLSLGFILISYIFVSEQLKTSLNVINSHRYMSYKMFRMIALIIQKPFLKWLILMIIISFIFFIILLMLKFLYLKIIKTRIWNETKQELILALILGFIIFLCAAWPINHYWLPYKFHPISLLGNIGILLLGIFMGWVLVRMKWVNVFSFMIDEQITRIPLVFIIPFVFIIPLAILNIGIVIHSKIIVPRGPNLIFVLIDALRADHLGCYGYERNTSPFLDRISQTGLLFENVISQSSWTKTSMPSIFTSTYPIIHNVRGLYDYFDDRWVTWAEIMKENSYYTVAFQTNTLLLAKTGIDQGFDEYHYFGNKTKAKELNSKVFSWLDNNHKRKFFLYIHYMDVHAPYIPPVNFDKFGNTSLDKYDGEILFIDNSINNLFEKLKSLGIYKDTIIIIASDHGEEFKEHGGLEHGKTLYQEQLRVPLIFASVDLSKHSNRRIDCLVENNDILPTVLDMLRINSSKYSDIRGRSLLKLLNSKYNKERYLFSTVGLNDLIPYNDISSVITSKNKKYIINKNIKSGLIQESLFDLNEDPKELNNLIANNQYSDIYIKLKTIVNEIYLKQQLYPKQKKKISIDKRTEQLLKSLGYLK